MELTILIIIVIFTIFVVVRSVSRPKRKIEKHTEPRREKSNYQNRSKSYPQHQPTFNAQPKKSPVAFKTKAQKAAEVKERIIDFPEVKVKHIIDGDTVIVQKNWHKIIIRLDSIDCPEQGQHWGDTAKYGLIKLIGGRKVRLEEHGIDPYQRTLATLYVQNGDGSEWMNVNARMVTLGHAWVMRRFYGHLPQDRQHKLNSLERWARSKNIGLWQTPNPIPPWKWRRTE